MWNIFFNISGDESKQYGLYASYVPGFLYAIFGTCKEVTIGPTAVNALMTYNYAGNFKKNIVEAALTLGFFSGLIEIATGVLNLGKQVDIYYLMT